VTYGDVFWADLPPANGHEQSGRRPVVIFQDTAAFSLPTVLVIPMTSKMSARRFPGGVLIQPTASNGLTSPSIALVFQLQVCDVPRIDESPIGHLDDPDLQAVQAMAKRLMKLP
jgi:mRNA interferase MazF